MSYPRIDHGDLDTSEAAQAHKSWELSKYSSKELKDELASREVPIMEETWGIDVFVSTPEQHDICKHNMEMGYCEVRGCAGSY